MSRGVAIAVLLVALAPGAVSDAVAQSPEEVFDRGNRAYEEGRYRDAAESYRAVTRYGVTDARLEYNLGNAEFKQGNLGRAILHYLRALRLDPTDRDARGNLELARSLRVDRIEEPVPAAPVRWALRLQERVGPDRQALAALALFWLVAGLVTWCSARPGGWSARAGWALGGLLIALVVVSASWWTTLQRLDNREQAVVLDAAVEALAGPGDNNATLFTIHEGTTVEIRAVRGNWIQAGLSNGLNGWLPKDSVERV